MSNKKSNNAKASAIALLKELPTKGNMKNSFYETLKTMGVGLIGAGIGAACGKPSLVIGFGTTLAGHYVESPRLAALGAGMMVSGGYQVGSGVSGPEPDGLEGIKDRIKSFGENLKARLYLDKLNLHLTAGKKEGTPTNGVGEIQYFNYPQNQLDMGALDNIENEIARSSEQFQQRQFAGAEDQFSGAEDQFSGAEEIAGVEERLL